MNLKEYFEEYCVCISKFASKAAVAENTIFRILNGYPTRRTTAQRIQEASHGIVELIPLLVGKDQDHKSQKKTNKKEKNDPTL